MIGSRKRRNGKSAPARSRIGSRMRCTSASPSVLSIAVRPFWSAISPPRPHCWPRSRRPARSGSKASMSAGSTGCALSPMPPAGTKCAPCSPPLAADGDDGFALDERGTLWWRGAAVGRLGGGDSLLAPRAELFTADFVEGEIRERVRRRLQSFVDGEIKRRLSPLFMAEALPLGHAGRGLAFQIKTALGTLPARDVAAQVAALAASERAALGRIGFRFGTESVYCEPLLRPQVLRFRALLWAVRQGWAPPPLPSSRSLGKGMAVDPAVPPSFYAALGFMVVGGFALRPDRVERLAATARRLARQGPFAASPELAAIAGVELAAMRGVLTGLGYRAVRENGGEIFMACPRRRRKTGKRAPRRPPAEGHPFAKLQELRLT